MDGMFDPPPLPPDFPAHLTLRKVCTDIVRAQVFLKVSPYRWKV